MISRPIFRTSFSNLALLSALAISSLGIVACNDSGSGSTSTYNALIRRTEGGVPHIKAHDFGSLGYGTGYAMAQDNVCIVADQMLRYSGERSRFLGPQNGNLESDFFYQLFIDRGEASQSVDERQASVFRGAAAGYNRFLRDTGVANLSDPNCKGQSWVRNLEEIDFRRVTRMNFFYPFLLSQIVAAAPPSTPLASASSTSHKISPAEGKKIQLALQKLIEPMKHMGSNGIAIGRDGTQSGTGMLLTNPHQPWTGSSRFWSFHQTIPGVLDIIGANVMGRPQVGFGATENVAWTSTVQTGPLFTFYRLNLVPGNPTQYMFDGQPRDMIKETVTVQVPDGNGGFTKKSHTFYSTHFGAMLVGGSFSWNSSVAFAVKAPDVGWRGLESFIPSYQAKSVQEYKAVMDKYQMNPANQMATDSSGNVYYANIAPIPNLDDAQRAACTVPGGFDGSRSECMWKNDPDAAAPGIIGPSKMPSLIRTDFVTNSNDSYWLANPLAPLTGFNSSLGTVNTARSFRTRAGLAQVMERIAGSDGKGAGKFTLDQLQQLITDNVSQTGRALRDDLVTLCQKNPSVTMSNGTAVDISAACPVLAAWDLRFTLDSRGAPLFREFAVTTPTLRNYAVPFSASDPVNTPRGLDTNNNPDVLKALATAVKRLRDANIPLDARLRELQYVTRNGERIPIHGGPEAPGVLNIINTTFTASVGGYPDVTGASSSWMMAVEYKEGGPVARGVMAYSQTTNPNSPHFADQTKAFSQGNWMNLPFREADVAAAATETLQIKE